MQQLHAVLPAASVVGLTGVPLLEGPGRPVRPAPELAALPVPAVVYTHRADPEAAPAESPAEERPLVATGDRSDVPAPLDSVGPKFRNERPGSKASENS